MSQSTNRILTTHVGSLIRPPDLLGLIEARQEGKPIDEAAFTATLCHSVREIVREQAEAGIDVVSEDRKLVTLRRGAVGRHRVQAGRRCLHLIDPG